MSPHFYEICPPTLPAPAIPAAPAIAAPAAPTGSPAAALAVNLSGFYDAAIQEADDSDIAMARMAGISDLELGIGAMAPTVNAKASHVLVDTEVQPTSGVPAVLVCRGVTGGWHSHLYTGNDGD